MSVIGEYKKITDFPIRQSGAGRITEVADPAGAAKTVLRTELHKEDGSPVTPTENPRCQLDTPFVIKTGNTYYAKHRCYIPSVANGGPPPELTTKFLAIFQIFGYPYEGSPPVSLKLSDEEGKGVKNRLLFQRNSSYAFDKPLTRDLTTDAWHTFLWGFKHDQEKNGGYIELWIDGIQQTFDFAGYNPNGHSSVTKLLMDTVDPGVNDNDAKEGGNTYVIHLYKKAGTWEPIHTYFDGVVIATTKAEAEAGLGGEGAGGGTKTMTVQMPISIAPALHFALTKTMKISMPISISPRLGFYVAPPEELPPPPTRPYERAAALIPKLKVPLVLDGPGLSVVEQGSVEEVSACVYALLATERGSRIEELDYGVRDPTFSEIPLAEDEWQNQIEGWEPRAAATIEQQVDSDEVTDQITVDVKEAVL